VASKMFFQQSSLSHRKQNIALVWQALL